MKKNFLKLAACFLSTIGILASGAASIGCVVLFLDEPVMPKALIER